MSAEIFEVPAPERINSPIWLAYLGGVNVVKWGVKVVDSLSNSGWDEGLDA